MKSRRAHKGRATRRHTNKRHSGRRHTNKRRSGRRHTNKRKSTKGGTGTPYVPYHIYALNELKQKTQKKQIPISMSTEEDILKSKCKNINYANFGLIADNKILKKIMKQIRKKHKLTKSELEKCITANLLENRHKNEIRSHKNETRSHKNSGPYGFSDTDDSLSSINSAYFKPKKLADRSSHTFTFEGPTVDEFSSDE